MSKRKSETYCVSHIELIVPQYFRLGMSNIVTYIYILAKVTEKKNLLSRSSVKIAKTQTDFWKHINGFVIITQFLKCASAKSPSLIHMHSRRSWEWCTVPVEYISCIYIGLEIKIRNYFEGAIMVSCKSCFAWPIYVSLRLPLNKFDFNSMESICDAPEMAQFTVIFQVSTEMIFKSALYWKHHIRTAHRASWKS